MPDAGVRGGPPLDACRWIFAASPVTQSYVTVDGTTISIFHEDGLGEAVRKITGVQDSRDVILSPDGRYLATYLRWPARVLVFDTDSGKLAGSISVEEKLFTLDTVSFSPDNEALLVAGTRHIVTETGVMVIRYLGGALYVYDWRRGLMTRSGRLTWTAGDLDSFTHAFMLSADDVLVEQIGGHVSSFSAESAPARSSQQGAGKR